MCRSELSGLAVSVVRPRAAISAKGQEAWLPMRRTTVPDISSQVDFMQVRAIRGRCSLLACARILTYGYMPTLIKYAFGD
jgi:hypothetical protein